jgi:hypothetical protein
MLRGLFTAVVGLAFLCTPFMANWVQAQGESNMISVADPEAAAIYGAQTTCSRGFYRNYDFCVFGQADTCNWSSAPCGGFFCPYSCKGTRPYVGYSGDPEGQYYTTTSPCAVMLAQETCSLGWFWCGCGPPATVVNACPVQTDTEIIFCN